MSLLNRKLTQEEKEDLLKKLFGFSFDDDVLIDNFGNDFYGQNHNLSYNLDTLKGIIQYHTAVVRRQTEIETKDEIRTRFSNLFN